MIGKKRVWIINHYANTPGQGGSLRHFNLSRQLVRRGYDVTIFNSSFVHNLGVNTIDTGNHELYQTSLHNDVGFITIRTPSYEGNSVDRIRNILTFYHRLLKVGSRIISENDISRIPDVIISSSFHPLALRAGTKLARKAGCEHIMEIRDLWPETLVSAKPNFNKVLLDILYHLEKKMYLQADKLIFTVEGGYDYIVERGWDDLIPAESVYYINNGVNVDEFACNRDSFVLNDSDLSDESVFKAVYAGAIGYVNNLGLLVDAADKLNQHGESHIRILVWGDGPELDRLKSDIGERHLTNIVFKGPVDKKYIPYILSMSDVNILQNKELDVHRFGTSQNKLFEYLAAGKPIIKVGRSGYDIVSQYYAGITLERYDAGCMAEALMSLANMDEEEYQAYCHNSAELALQFDFNKWADMLVKAIED
jgi:glycosyltransferase involved in cell wall biosynthesis